MNGLRLLVALLMGLNITQVVFFTFNINLLIQNHKYKYISVLMCMHSHLMCIDVYVQSFDVFIQSFDVY